MLSALVRPFPVASRFIPSHLIRLLRQDIQKSRQYDFWRKIERTVTEPDCS